MVGNVNHMAVISQSSWNVSVEIVFETNTVVNVRLNGSCDKNIKYTCTLFCRNWIFYDLGLRRFDYNETDRGTKIDTRSSLFQQTPVDLQFFFFFFVICCTHFSVLPRNQWHIFEGCSTSDVGPWIFFMLLCYCIIDICLYVLYVCVFYNNTVVEFK